MTPQTPNFADSWEYRELLDISKSHLADMDRTRVHADHVVGNDTYAKLQVATVFAAIAIEAALNDFIESHTLFINLPYLQTFVADVSDQFLRSNLDQKLTLLKRCWKHTPFPDNVIQDVKTLFEVRNQIAHQKRKLVRDELASHGVHKMTNRAIEPRFVPYMLRSHDIAEDFLKRFWLPGNKELQQGSQATEVHDGSDNN